MDKKLIITNLLSVTIAITGTLFAVGCANDKKPAADLEEDSRDAVASEDTYKEDVQELAEALYSEGRLHQHVNPFDLEIEKVSNHSFRINEDTLPAQDEQNGYKFFKAGDNLYLIKETADGFEGEVHISTELATEADIEQTVVKAFFKSVTIANASQVQTDLQNLANTNAKLNLFATYWNADEDQVVSSQGLQLVETIKSSIQLTPNQDHSDPGSANYPVDITFNFNSTESNHEAVIEEGLQSLFAKSFSIRSAPGLDPVYIAFDIKIKESLTSEEETKTLEIRHTNNDNTAQVVDSGDQTTQEEEAQVAAEVQDDTDAEEQL